MPSANPCPSCGAALLDGQSCADDFGLLLSWEWQYNMQAVHHLLVLGYHLQHPHLYSQQGLRGGLDLLRQFMTESKPPSQVRAAIRESVSNSQRSEPITARTGNIGAYDEQPAWSLTIADVVAAGPQRFYDSVRAWLESQVIALRAYGLLD